MLKSLQIKDYALIETINIGFGRGLNIITGETGAGKSILVDSLGLLLGERASTDVIRKGAIKSIVEGVFDVESNNKVKGILNENQLDFDSELIVRREISLKGSNRCFLNDTPVNLNLIKEVGNLLVDLHGQHDHQSLLSPEIHVELLDDFGEIGNLLEEYSYSYSELKKHMSELKELKKKESILNEKKDYFEFQMKEIDNISPKLDEDEELEDKLKILENAEKLLELSTGIFQHLYDGENTIHDGLVKIGNSLRELSKIDKTFSESSNEMESVIVTINDVADFLRSYIDRIELDSDKLEDVRERLAAFNLLKKKYGGSIKKVIEFREKIGSEFELAENFADRIKDLNNRIDELKVECGRSAEKLSIKRNEISKKLEKDVERELKTLGISDSRFEVKIINKKADEDSDNYIIIKKEKYQYYKNGYDEVEFYISTNIGEDTKPLSKVASGGEVSRIMLALKSILAKNEKLPVLIFDEIDAGISGRIAQKVGQSLKSLAAFHQIIVITHLPQIASLSDFHYSVQKKLLGERVISSIQPLNESEKVNEVAKLISGEELTEASIEGAKELLGMNKEI